MYYVIRICCPTNTDVAIQTAAVRNAPGTSCIQTTHATSDIGIDTEKQCSATGFVWLTISTCVDYELNCPYLYDTIR